MSERRCKHGFMRTVAPCVECDSAERGVPVPAAPVSRRADHNRTYRCSACGGLGHAKRTCGRADRRERHSTRGRYK